MVRWKVRFWGVGGEGCEGGGVGGCEEGGGGGCWGVFWRGPVRPQVRNWLRVGDGVSLAVGGSSRWEPLEMGCCSSLMSFFSSSWEMVSSLLVPFAPLWFSLPCEVSAGLSGPVWSSWVSPWASRLGFPVSNSNRSGLVSISFCAALAV